MSPCLKRAIMPKTLLTELIGDHIIGEDSDQLAMALQRALVEQGMSVTTAESCTGGLIASLITKEAGSSQVFGAGFVTYANASKQKVLDVPESALSSHGAVSEPVVRSMLRGALAKASADIGIAVSGVAGPGGGTEEKPVGTVWLAWGTETKNDAIRLQIPGSRERFQILVAAIGLDLMRRQVLNLPLSRTTSSALFIETLKPSRNTSNRFSQPHHSEEHQVSGYGSRL